MVDSIQKLVKNKSVLFVGNSVEMMEHDLADFIDGFDIVVRFGRAISANEKQQKQLGSKCDIWITGQFRAPEWHKNRKNFETGKYKNTKILVNRCRGNFILKEWKLEEHLPKNMPYEFMYSDQEIIDLMNNRFNKDMIDTSEYRPSAGFISLIWFIEKIKVYKDIHLIGFDFFAKQTNIKPRDKQGVESGCKPHSWHLPVYVLKRPAHDSKMEQKYVKQLEKNKLLHWYILSDLEEGVVKYNGWMKGEKIISSIPKKTKISKI